MRKPWWWEVPRKFRTCPRTSVPVPVPVVPDVAVVSAVLVTGTGRGIEVVEEINW